MKKQVEDALKDISTEAFHTPEELQCAVDYYRAQSISSRLLKIGTITKEQFNRLTVLNLCTYAPRFEAVLACMNGTF